MLAVAAVLAAALAGCSSGGGAGGETGCEGVAGLCGRRLNEVVLPATHNSFAASSEPGWYFANQTYGIGRQLHDGIRALLLDVHYGVYDEASGRVRTDLAAEGSDRNKVAEQVPPSALALADRLAGTVGIGTLSGTPQLYLCHTLCELGAEPLERELGVIREFLEHNPHEVVVVIVEDYVPPAAIADAFEQAGLGAYVATLDRDAPLPTLGSLVQENRRLVVFAEEHGGSPAWYMPAFSFIQDTPLGAASAAQLSCARYRGEADSPLLLLNHWIPPFPPSPTLNAAIGRSSVLRTRILRCMRERDARGAIVAVDFYERTAVVATARALDEQG